MTVTVGAGSVAAAQPASKSIDVMAAADQAGFMVPPMLGTLPILHANGQEGHYGEPPAL